ncbi:MAG: hypothetical protein H6733_16745 [Alphaproteobacteria bacterium]|nr:hypothetical protein [Alphaproteobacteria bacterium]
MNDIPVVLLCGGRGVWVDGSGARVPKPLVEVAGRTLVEHGVDAWRHAGARRFVLAAGTGADALDAVFAAQATGRDALGWMLADGTRVMVVDTGDDTPTADRLRAVRPHVADAATVAVHYSDVLSTVDLHAVLAFHRAHGRLATMVGARMPIRFRIVGVRPGETTVRGFASRPVVPSSWINGGYYLFEQAVLDEAWLPAEVRLLEDDLLARLAAATELELFGFEGAWQYLDGERHVPLMAAIVEATHPGRRA